MERSERNPGDHAPVVGLAGDIDVANAASLGDVLCSNVDSFGAPVLIIDCTKVEFLEARALAMMERVHEHGAARGTEIVWRGLARRHRNVIELTGLDRLLLVAS